VRLLVAAGLLGMVRPAAAQPAPAGTWQAQPEELRLPGAVPPAPPPAAAPAVADKPAEKRPSLDLLTPPSLPAHWSRAPAPVQPTPATAVGQVGNLPPRPQPQVQSGWQPAPRTESDTVSRVSTPPAAAPAQPADPQVPPAKLPPLYPTRKWPPAHLVRHASVAGDTGPVLSNSPKPPPAAPAPRVVPVPVVTRAPTPMPILAPAPPPPVVVPAMHDPIAVAPKPTQAPAVTIPAGPVQWWNVRRHVVQACGSAARDVLVYHDGPDDLVVKVRVVDAAVQRQLSDKLLKLPDLSDPRVHLVFDVKP
jgi:hypothetical protein